ncbi:MAG: YceH family protein [Bryobacteraceae bacterium]|nr:YceH family protein [Bryobacteraceae bacterium]MDW8379391.1 YceH family protein [Bryobacterales bacterium]
MRSVFFGGVSQPDRSSESFLLPELTAEELRVLGCLMEKQYLTPDVYPMSLNGVMTACNQKTSRDPVVAYDEETVLRTLESLQAKGLVERIVGPEHRVPKYRELFSEKAELRVSELALLCVMMLRGPQTTSELRERTNRIHEFADATEVEAVLERLAQRRPQPLVVRLARMPGQKEARSMHLLGGPVEREAVHCTKTVSLPSAAHPAPDSQQERLERLETETADLRTRLAELEKQVAELRSLLL